jgi:hypothetical protein
LGAVDDPDHNDGSMTLFTPSALTLSVAAPVMGSPLPTLDMPVRTAELLAVVEKPKGATSRKKPGHTAKYG